MNAVIGWLINHMMLDLDLIRQASAAMVVNPYRHCLTITQAQCLPADLVADSFCFARFRSRTPRPVAITVTLAHS